ANPDLIFLANGKAEGMDAGTVASRPGWETIDAVAHDQVINIDDDLASRWGPRVPELVEQIAEDINQLIIPNMDNSAEPVAAN
ncbi:MAG: ABC transporter substrate-binding protein, partial [Corynebacterium sp.]|nr:ABC transporter substrate-binding protein [Corynebacterium sp.]